MNNVFKSNYDTIIIIDNFNKKYTLKKLEPSIITETEWKNYFNHVERIFREFSSDPLDKSPSREVQKSFILEPHPHYAGSIFRWLLILPKDNEIFGYAQLWFPNEKSPDYEAYKDIIYCHISIDKKYRRRGIGSNILKQLSNIVKEKNRQTIRFEVYNDPARSFLNIFNGEITAEGYRSRLYLKDVDWKLINNWRVNSKVKAKEAKIEVYSNYIPENILEDYCEILTETWNQAPAGDMPNENIFSPEWRRSTEKVANDKGTEWITMITREQEGVMSGITEIFHNPREDYAEQDITGVRVRYRGRNLGKWLKAEMIYYLKDKYPSIRYIITGNNEKNAPMLSINTRMGYKKYQRRTFYNIKLEELVKKLNTK